MVKQVGQIFIHITAFEKKRGRQEEFNADCTAWRTLIFTQSAAAPESITDVSILQVYIDLKS